MAEFGSARANPRINTKYIYLIAVSVKADTAAEEDSFSQHSVSETAEMVGVLTVRPSTLFLSRFTTSSGSRYVPAKRLVPFTT